jgi:hypothetical protein
MPCHAAVIPENLTQVIQRNRRPGLKAGSGPACHPSGRVAWPINKYLGDNMKPTFMQSGKSLVRHRLTVACALALAAAAGPSHADQASDMAAKLELLQQQIAALQAQMKTMAAEAKQRPVEAAHAAPSAVAMKPGNDLTFMVGGGEVTLYGHADVSLDTQTNGMAGFLNNGVPVTGHNG